MLNFKTLKNIEDLINKAEALIITAGAGIGVDSGLPDFRGNEGFWKAYPAISHLGLSFSEMANPEWFAHKPRLAWAFYGHRLNLYRETVPHKGFKMLLNYAKSLKNGYFIYTSNVDGQFQKAGFSPDFIEEIHGSIHSFQCSEPCSSNIWEADTEKIIIDEENFSATGNLPVCPHCGAIARPNILMFGDWNWLPSKSLLQQQNFNNWLSKVKSEKAKTLIIEIGAGKSIPSVRNKSENLSANLNAPLIRINPRDFEIPFGIKGFEIPSGALEGILSIL